LNVCGAGDLRAKGQREEEHDGKREDAQEFRALSGAMSAAMHCGKPPNGQQVEPPLLGRAEASTFVTALSSELL
jgi:hypothetical protein